MQKQPKINLSYLSTIERSIYNDLQSTFIQVNKNVEDFINKFSLPYSTNFWNKLMGGGSAFFTSLFDGVRDLIVDSVFGVGQIVNRLGHGVYKSVTENNYNHLAMAIVDSGMDIITGTSSMVSGVAADIGGLFGANTDWAYGDSGLLEQIRHGDSKWRSKALDGLYGTENSENFKTNSELAPLGKLETPELDRGDSYADEGFENWTNRINEWHNTTKGFVGNLNVDFLKGPNYDKLVESARLGDKSALNTLNVSTMVGDIGGRMVSAIILSKLTKGLSESLGVSPEVAGTIAQLSGRIVFTSSIFGSSFNRALNNGSSIQDAYIYGTGQAMQTFILDSTIGALGGKLSRALNKVITNNIDNILLRDFLNALSSSAVQKAPSMVLRGYGSRGLEPYADPDLSFADMQRTQKEIFEQTWQTFFVSLIMDTVTGFIQENKISRKTSRNEIIQIQKEFNKLLKDGNRERASEVIEDLLTRLNNPDTRVYDGGVGAKMSYEDRLALIRQLGLASFILEKDPVREALEVKGEKVKTTTDFDKNKEPFVFDKTRFQIQFEHNIYDGKIVTTDEYAFNKAVFGEIKLQKGRKLALRSEVPQEVLDFIDNLNIPVVLYKGSSEDGFYSRSKTLIGQEFIAVNTENIEFKSGKFDRVTFLHEGAHYITSKMSGVKVKEWEETIRGLEEKNLLPPELQKRLGSIRKGIIEKVIFDMGISPQEFKNENEMLQEIKNYDKVNNTNLYDKTMNEVSAEYIAYTFENFNDRNLQLAFAGEKENWFMRFKNIFVKDNALDYLKVNLNKENKKTLETLQKLQNDFIKETYRITAMHNTINTAIRSFNHVNVSLWEAINKKMINPEVVKNHTAMEIANALAFKHKGTIDENYYEKEYGNGFVTYDKEARSKAEEGNNFSEAIVINGKFYPIETFFIHGKSGSDYYMKLIDQFYGSLDAEFVTFYEDVHTAKDVKKYPVQEQALILAFRRIVERPNFEQMVEEFEIRPESQHAYTRRINEKINELMDQNKSVKKYRDLLTKIVDTENGINNLNEVETRLLKTLMVQRRYEKDLDAYKGTVGNADELVSARASKALVAQLTKYINNNFGMFNEFKNSVNNTAPAHSKYQAVMEGKIKDLYKDYESTLETNYVDTIKYGLEMLLGTVPMLANNYDVDVQISGEDYKITISPNEKAHYHQLNLTKKRNHLTFGIKERGLAEINQDVFQKSTQIVLQHGNYSVGNVLYKIGQKDEEYVKDITDELNKNEVVVAHLPSNWKANSRLHDLLPANVRIVDAYIDDRISRSERIATLVVTTNQNFKPTENFRMTANDLNGIKGQFSFTTYDKDYDIKISPDTVMAVDYYLKNESIPNKKDDDVRVLYIKAENKRALDVLTEIDWNDLLLRSSSADRFRITREDVVGAYREKLKEIANDENLLYRKSKEKEVTFKKEIEKTNKKRKILSDAVGGKNFIIDNYMEKDANGNYRFVYKNIYANKQDKYTKQKASIKMPMGKDQDGKPQYKEYSTEEYAIHLYNGSFTFANVDPFQRYLKSLIEEYGIARLDELTERERTLHEEILSKSKMNYIITNKSGSAAGFAPGIMPASDEIPPIFFITRRGLKEKTNYVIETLIHEQQHLFFEDMVSDVKQFENYVKLVETLMKIAFNDGVLLDKINDRYSGDFDYYIFNIGSYKQNYTNFRKMYEKKYGKSFRRGTTEEDKKRDVYRIVKHSLEYLVDDLGVELGDPNFSVHQKRFDFRKNKEGLGFLNEFVAQMFGVIFSDTKTTADVFFYNPNVDFKKAGAMLNDLVSYLPSKSMHKGVFENAVKETQQYFLQRLEKIHGTSIKTEKAGRIPKEQQLPKINEWFKEYAKGTGFTDIRDLVAEASKNFQNNYYGRGRRVFTELLTTLQNIENKTVEQQQAFEMMRDLYNSMEKIGELIVKDSTFLNNVKSVTRIKDGLFVLKTLLEKLNNKRLTEKQWEKEKNTIEKLIDNFSDNFDILTNDLNSPEIFVNFLNILNVTVSDQEDVEKISQEIVNKFNQLGIKLQEFLIDLDNVGEVTTGEPEKKIYKVQDHFNRNLELQQHLKEIDKFFEAFENTPLGTNIIKDLFKFKSEEEGRIRKTFLDSAKKGHAQTAKMLKTSYDNVDFKNFHGPTVAVENFIHEIESLLSAVNLSKGEIQKELEYITKDFLKKYMPKVYTLEDLMEERKSIDIFFSDFKLSRKDRAKISEVGYKFRQSRSGLLNLVTLIEHLFETEEGFLRKIVLNDDQFEKITHEYYPEDVLKNPKLGKLTEGVIKNLIEGVAPIKKTFEYPYRDNGIPLKMWTMLTVYKTKDVYLNRNGKTISRWPLKSKGIRKAVYDFVEPLVIYKNLDVGIHYFDNIKNNFIATEKIRATYDNMFDDLVDKIREIDSKVLSQEVFFPYTELLSVDSELLSLTKQKADEYFEKGQEELNKIQDRINALELELKKTLGNLEKRTIREKIIKEKRLHADAKQKLRTFNRTNLERLIRTQIIHDGGEEMAKKYGTTLTVGQALLIFATAHNMIISNKSNMNEGREIKLEQRVGGKVQEAKTIIIGFENAEEIIKVMEEKLFSIPNVAEIYDLIGALKEETSRDLADHMYNIYNVDIQLIGKHYVPLIFGQGKHYDVLTFHEFATSLKNTLKREKDTNLPLYVRNDILYDLKLILNSIFRMKINPLTMEWQDIYSKSELKEQIETLMPGFIEYHDLINKRSIGFTPYKQEYDWFTRTAYSTKVTISGITVTLMAPFVAMHLNTEFYRKTGIQSLNTKDLVLATVKSMYKNDEDKKIKERLLEDPLFKKLIIRSGHALDETPKNKFVRGFRNVQYTPAREINLASAVIQVKKYIKAGYPFEEAIKETIEDSLVSIVNGISGFRSKKLHERSFGHTIAYLFSNTAFKNFGRMFDGNMFNTTTRSDLISKPKKEPIRINKVNTNTDDELESWGETINNENQTNEEYNEQQHSKEFFEQFGNFTGDEDWTRKEGSSINDRSENKNFYTGKVIDSQHSYLNGIKNLMLSFIGIALVKSLFNIGTGRRKKENFASDFLINELLLRNILGSVPLVSIASKNVYFKDGFKTTQGLRAPVYHEILNVFNTTVRILEGKASARDYINFATDISTLFGLPLKNMVNLMKDLTHIIGATGNTSALEISAFLTGNNKSVQLNEALKAGNTKKAGSIMRQMFDNEDVVKEVSRIVIADQNAKINFYNNLETFTRIENGRAKVYHVPSALRIKYTGLIEQAIRTIIKSASYKRIKSEQDKAKAIQRVINYYYNLMKQETLNGRIGKYDNPREVVTRSLDYYWREEEKKKRIK